MAINWLKTSRGTHEQTAFSAAEPEVKEIEKNKKKDFRRNVYITACDKYSVIRRYNNDYFVI